MVAILQEKWNFSLLRTAGNVAINMPRKDMLCRLLERSGLRRKHASQWLYILVRLSHDLFTTYKNERQIGCSGEMNWNAAPRHGQAYRSCGRSACHPSKPLDFVRDSGPRTCRIKKGDWDTSEETGMRTQAGLRELLADHLMPAAEALVRKEEGERSGAWRARIGAGSWRERRAFAACGRIATGR